MKRRRIPNKSLLIYGSCLLLAVAVVVVLQLIFRHKASSTPLVLTQANSSMLEHSITSTDRNVQSSALVPSLRSAYLSSKQHMLPAGVTVAIERNTFRANGDSAQVLAKVPDHGVFVMHLVRSGNGWLLLYTESQNG